ncbi:hypothetical protein N7467_005665 [Penicillium canescens]|nr:hypothetical protein N7467_005665 [Penicillium canescens]
MAESNATMSLPQDLADFFYHLDTLIYDFEAQVPARRQECKPHLISLGQLVYFPVAEKGS